MSTALDLPRNTPPSVASKYAAMLNRLDNIKEKAKEQTANVTRTAACFAAGGAIGYAEGRYGYRELAGQPLPAVVGVAAKVGAFALGNSAEGAILDAAGNGALAVQGYLSAKKIGEEAKAKQGAKSSGYQVFNG